MALRISRADLDLIERASQVAGKTPAQFVREAALNAATEALVDQVNVSPGVYEAFLAKLEEPPNQMSA